MYIQLGSNSGARGLGAACVVPAGVTLRHVVLTDADRTAIGTALGLGRAATADEVRAAITGAIARAVVLINDAADPLRWPRAAGAAGEPMRRRFHDAFGTRPEFVPPDRPAGERWDMGAIVRERLRCAAKIMSEGHIHYVAWGPGSCPFTYAWAATTWAVVEAGRYRICLGARFWRASRLGDVDGLATTLLHECLHIYFDTIRHERERWPFNRAACYERYVLVANGLPVPAAVSGPCASSAPAGDFPVPRRDAPRFAGLGGIGVPATVDCLPEPGEVALSQTDAGVLTKDVEGTTKGLLVADFGVNERSVKPGAIKELAPFLADWEKDDSIKSISITGFDDCLKATPAVHRYYREQRPLRIKALLGPKARTKVTFVGGAPLGTFFGPNTDRAARARNRSVLIKVEREVTIEPETITATVPDCTQPLMIKALEHMRADPAMDTSLKSRLGVAIANSIAGRDDSFIRPGGTGWMIPFHWSSIKLYFRLICSQPGGTALNRSDLRRKLVELDQDIITGLESLEREEKRAGSMDKKALLASTFRGRLNALVKNKANSVYALY